MTVDCESAGADETVADSDEVASDGVEASDGIEASADVEAGEVAVTVADDGPGVPEHEIEAIEAGRETALEHGSGLGLWIVHWAAASVGGDVSFADREPRGTVATLRFPVDVAWETDDVRAGSGQGS